MDTTMAGEKAKAAQLAHWDPKQPEKHSNLGVSWLRLLLQLAQRHIYGSIKDTLL